MTEVFTEQAPSFLGMAIGGVVGIFSPMIWSIIAFIVPFWFVAYVMYWSMNHNVKLKWWGKLLTYFVVAVLAQISLTIAAEAIFGADRFTSPLIAALLPIPLAVVALFYGVFRSLLKRGLHGVRDFVSVGLAIFLVAYAFSLA